MMLSSSAVDQGAGRQTRNHGEIHRHWTPAVRQPWMRPKGLTIAKTLAMISTVTHTAGWKKSLARRSTGLDYSSVRDHEPVMTKLLGPARCSS